MREHVDLGFAGLSVPAGTHICGFFRGRRERNATVEPFIHAGIVSGAKCRCVLDTADELDAADEKALAKELGVENSDPDAFTRGRP